jgi:cell division protein ZapA
MSEITIEIGGRAFEVSCQQGEEPYLQAAAKMLDKEAAALEAQIGRTPEPRMLLMAGLMLADKTAGLQDKLTAAEEKMAGMEAELAQLRDASPTAEEPEKIEVPVMPEGVNEALTGIATQAEALADIADGLQGETL